LLGLGRDLARAVGVERLVTITRIKGGVAFQAPGMAFALLADRVLVIHWTRAPEALRGVQDWLTQRLGDAFPIEDIRAVAAGRTAGRSARPPEHAADRFDPDPAEPDHLREVNDEKVIPTAADDEDDPGPGL
jgi:hypothetical protein